MPDQPASWEDIADFIQDAASQMREFGLTTLDVEHDGSRVRIKIEAPKAARVAPISAGDTVIHAAVDHRDASATSSDHIVTSPMIGTFYASSSPGEPPFVEEGDDVEIGQVIGIIEAMKIMNEITSEHEGSISKILVKNAQAVEYGQPLFQITPAG